jgi:hypothetical protein
MDRFIFIVGCGHSGTSILNKIICNHKDIIGSQVETGLFYDNEKNINYNLNKFKNERLIQNKKYFCEKTPTHVYKINEMYKYTTNPRIIVITRDGRDVICSLNKRYGCIKKSLDRWINDNKEWLKNLNINNFHILKYEDLVKNKHETMRKICIFLEIEYYDEIFNYSINSNITLPEKFYHGLIDNGKHNKLREYQLNQEFYDGTGRWINNLTEEEIKILYSNTEFVNIMLKLGYKI